MGGRRQEGTRGQQRKRARDDGRSGLRTREGRQESFTRYLYISDLNQHPETDRWTYIIIPLVFVGSFSP